MRVWGEEGVVRRVDLLTSILDWGGGRGEEEEEEEVDTIG